MKLPKRLFLFTPWFMGVLFIVFAMAMAFATFYENDFGADAARLLVYNAKWFEILMLLMIVNLAGQILLFKLYKRKKLTVMLFHLAFVLIIVGAGITRYFGFEGVVHIRENATQNICTSVNKYINLEIKNNNGELLYSDSKKAIISSVKKERYSKKISVDNVDYSLRFNEYLPNAAEKIIEVEKGIPMVSFLVSMGMSGRQSIILKKGDIKTIGNLKFGFTEDKNIDVRIVLEEDSFRIQSLYAISEMSMMTQSAAFLEPGESILFEKMKVYKLLGLSIVPEVISKNGEVEVFNLNHKVHQTNKSVIVFDLEYENKLTELYLWMGQGAENQVKLKNEKHLIEISYKPLEVDLPFSLKLVDFILDRYPGSTSPSSYKSNVVLIDEENEVRMPYSIYMNHILKYKGWRFYQSSYDKDEKGTILSVNRDFAGMIVTYFGYFILFLFILLTMANKNSAFRTVTKNYFTSSGSKVTALLILFLASTVFVNAQDQKFIVDKAQANKFGEILVQNQKGRTEPLYTLTNDILRKVAKETELNGYSPMQIFLGLYFDFQNWQNVPLIRVSNAEIRYMLGLSGNYAAFTDIVDLQTNAYILKQSLNVAYAKSAGQRNKFDKEIIKVDERLNICFMIYSGEFMKIFPVKDQSLKWQSPKDAYKFVADTEDSLYLRNIVNLFAQGIQSGNENGDYLQANKVLKSIIAYQRNFAQYDLPSVKKINAEIFYYRSKVYDRLFPFYATLGLVLLIILIYGIITQRKNLSVVIKIFTGFLILAFLFHSLGLAIRWYVSGHAPMSNGYESMIFISWVIILAGFIFSKRSAFVLAATSVLGGFTLMVAHLSFMDPEITNLVPVLQSYWLTLHVSVITGSYGFLGLGAIIGIIVLILYSVVSENNKDSINSTIEELTVVNYKSITIGLYLLTIGTFLGAIWANESWGRYWGWDPKETWSLITIIVYSFVIHSRMIHGLKGFYAFNILALFGFASVLMTYFGVNYYLSGLHSYAGGDPIPVPKLVYLSVVALITLSFFAYYKYKRISK